MLNRRLFLQRGLGGFGALAIGSLGRRALAGFQDTGAGCIPTGALPYLSSGPFLRVPGNPASVDVLGMPFASWFGGDDFPNESIPFHTGDSPPGGALPTPQETVDIAIIGGGLSGLATAYLLRDHKPVVFELHQRFGGVSQGEAWKNTRYSLGGAYFITPDKGTFLERFYTELGLDQSYKLSIDDDLVELNGKLNPDFWSGAGLSPEEQAAFQQYAKMVTYYAERAYPDIPLLEGRDNQWILDLDTRNLKEDVELKLGGPAPALLAAGIQAYCYSSFGAGWEQISAASGWNFIAAEEFGRWVLPGGNAGMVDALWQKLRALEMDTPPGCPPRCLRAGCRVVDVRLAPKDMVQVTYIDTQGTWRSVLAKKAVVCCSKHIAKYIIHDLDVLDADKANAFHAVAPHAYVVANVLLDAPIDLDFYDLFLLGDGKNYPTNPGEAMAWWHVADVVNGSFAQPGQSPHSVLTLYWPIPSPKGLFTLIVDDAWQNYAERIVPQIDEILALLKLDRSVVRQVRMARWGHAMPVAFPNFIASGLPDVVRRPIQDKIYFINQDNWLLPAVETCLLEAEIWTPQVAKGL